MLTFTAKLTVKAGSEQEFERIMRIAVPKVREEPGNHAYILHRSTQDPRVFMCYEEYDDQAALEAHRAHLREMGIDLRALLDGPPMVEFYDKLV
jgi:quinol monooxygenase YgiN